jgi:hypothetical protein
MGEQAGQFAGIARAWALAGRRAVGRIIFSDQLGMIGNARMENRWLSLAEIAA